MMRSDMELPRRILIVGLGASGVAVAKYLYKMGKQIAIADEKSESELSGRIAELSGIPYEAHFGPHQKKDFLSYPMIVLSPGVDSELPVLKQARNNGIRIMGEVELASRYIKEPVIAITGTNGKTTTTALIGEIFRKAFGDVFVGGNIGTPLVEYLEQSKRSHVVVEISSFQLETIETFRPNTAILLNIAEDHLDRYRSYNEYKSAKYRIFQNQTQSDYAIINANILPAIRGKAKILPFSIQQETSEGAFARNGNMYVRLDGREFVYKRELSPLMGLHNTENILTALLTAHIYGIDKEITEHVLRTFKGLPHRIEYVRTVDGVSYYDDSKATNVDSTRRALEGIDRKIILIVGGKDKGGSYQIIKSAADRIKAIVAIGEAKQKIMSELGDAIDVFAEINMEGAVNRAHTLASAADVVLLSPMCSSFDMFKDYRERGNVFRRIVESL